ncbi:hypothetical protein [Streptomyces cadmiisoli]|uniref:hypothetical protein n=1 Tax=Streptomyces cadmiisoli TaxID=2184053 RepID=UPI0013A6E191|nr:hypothetical protein [Streptomyces cadmiisoli]
MHDSQIDSKWKVDRCEAVAFHRVPLAGLVVVLPAGLASGEPPARQEVQGAAVHLGDAAVVGDATPDEQPGRG